MHFHNCIVMERENVCGLVRTGVYHKPESHYFDSDQPWKQKLKVGIFVHKSSLIHFHSSYLWLFCLTQSFLINHLSLHFNKTSFMYSVILLTFLKRSLKLLTSLGPTRRSISWPISCWLPGMIGTLHREKIRL